MTKKNFLSVLEFVGEETLANCASDASNYETLQLISAMESLRKELYATGSKIKLGLETIHDERDDDSGVAESVSPPVALALPLHHRL